MKEERLMRILTDLDDDLILEAEPSISYVAHQEPVQKKRFFQQKWVLSAAALLLVFTLWKVWPTTNREQAVAETALQAEMDVEGNVESFEGADAATEAAAAKQAPALESTEAALMIEGELPKIGIPEAIRAEGMGMGYLAFKSPEEMEPDPFYDAVKGSATLPVFQQPPLNVDRMREVGVEVLEKLALDASTITEEIRYRNQPNADIGEEEIPKEDLIVESILLSGEGFEVDIDDQLNATVRYTGDAVPEIPKQMNFQAGATTEELLAAGTYLADRFGKPLGLTDPTAVLTGGDYTIFGTRIFDLIVRNRGFAQEILQSGTARTLSFGQKEDGSLEWIRISGNAYQEKVGEYPILTEKEAVEILKSGEAMTLSPVDFPGVEFLARTSVVYRENYQGAMIPYYAFKAEIPGERWPDLREESDATELKFFDDIKVYGTFYIPAVRPEYLEVLPETEIRGQ